MGATRGIIRSHLEVIFEVWREVHDIPFTEPLEALRMAEQDENGVMFSDAERGWLRDFVALWNNRESMR